MKRASNDILVEESDFSGKRATLKATEKKSRVQLQEAFLRQRFDYDSHLAVYCFSLQHFLGGENAFDKDLTV